MNRSEIHWVLVTLQDTVHEKRTTQEIIESWGPFEQLNSWQKNAVMLLRGRKNEEISDPNGEYWKYLIENLSSLLRIDPNKEDSVQSTWILSDYQVTLFEKAAKLWELLTNIRSRKENVNSIIL